MSIVTGTDGIARCGWVGTDPLYIEYHDREWGRPLRGDVAVFERVALEGFQAGLSWISILRRRERFRAAFHGFDLHRVAAIDDDEVEALMADEGIIRNRAKIIATRTNARAALSLDGGISALVWSFAPQARHGAIRYDDIPAQTPASVALSAELKRRGFAFVGPTTMYALMQAIGMVNDHAEGCDFATHD